jgi:hypothetical protein
MVRFLAGIGVRITEMLPIRLSDLRPESGNIIDIRVLGKKGKERWMHINADLNGNEFLFEHNGRTFNAFPLRAGSSMDPCGSSDGRSRRNSLGTPGLVSKFDEVRASARWRPFSDTPTRGAPRSFSRTIRWFPSKRFSTSMLLNRRPRGNDAFLTPRLVLRNREA